MVADPGHDLPGVGHDLRLSSPFTGQPVKGDLRLLGRKLGFEQGDHGQLAGLPRRPLAGRHLGGWFDGDRGRLADFGHGILRAIRRP